MVVAYLREIVERHHLASELIFEPKILILEHLVLIAEPLHFFVASAPIAAVKIRGTDRNKKAGDKQAKRESREKRQHSFKKTFATHQYYYLSNL